MYERFGEFNSSEELNETAVNLRKEKDIESIRVLAKENGIDEDLAEMFIAGDVLYLCDDMSAAVGKLEVERAEVMKAEIIGDWIQYIIDMCFKDEEYARKVRSKEKSLNGCIAELLKWSFKNAYPVDKKILSAAGVNNASCKLGIPGAATAKKIIRDYYLGK